MDCSILVLNWLVAAFDIYDAQAGICQSDIRVDVESRIIGSAMVKDFNHPFEEGFIVDAGEAGYTAEIGSLLALNVWLNAGSLMKFVMSTSDTCMSHKRNVHISCIPIRSQ